MEYFKNTNEGFSKIVSMGNKAVLDEADIMDMLKSDPYTDVIMLYIEGIGDGRKFMDVAERQILQRICSILQDCSRSTEKSRGALQ